MRLSDVVTEKAHGESGCKLRMQLGTLKIVQPPPVLVFLLASNDQYTGGPDIKLVHYHGD